MVTTTNVPNGYQYGANTRIFNGGLANAASNFMGGGSNAVGGVINSFMAGLTNIVGASANVVSAVSPEVAQAVTAGIGASSGVPNLSGLGSQDPNPKAGILWGDDVVNNTDTNASRYMVIGGVVLGVVVIVLVFFMFKKKGGK